MPRIGKAKAKVRTAPAAGDAKTSSSGLATNPASVHPSAHPKASKTARLVDLLSREGGVTIAELCDATGWQQHSVRIAWQCACERVQSAFRRRQLCRFRIRIVGLIPPSARTQPGRRAECWRAVL